MHRRTVLAVLALTLSLMIGAQIASTQVRANVISADVNIEPDALLLEESNHGMWITAYINLTEPYDVNNINVSSVWLEVMGGRVSVSRYEIQGSTLIVKFDRQAVIDLLWSMLAHMTIHVKDEAQLTVRGELYTGETFQGSDTINVFFTRT